MRGVQTSQSPDFLRAFAFLFWFFSLATVSQAQEGVSERVEVTVLTQTPKLLKSWGADEIKQLRATGQFTAQRLIFEESAKVMELNERADIDLVTIFGEDADGKPKRARVPRFMIWRGALKIEWDAKKKSLRSWGTTTHLKVPLDLFEVRKITKFELSRHAVVYPGTTLKIRTNPAASRGQKFFTQNCMACHSFAKPLEPTQLKGDVFEKFAERHQRFPSLRLEHRDIRGLTAYSEALALERNQVPSAK